MDRGVDIFQKAGGFNGGVEAIGVTLFDILSAYALSTGEPWSDIPKTVSPAISNLMGGRVLPSFAVIGPKGRMNRVTGGTPYNIGEVLEEMHIFLRTEVWAPNIHLDPHAFPTQMMRTTLADPYIEGFFTRQKEIFLAAPQGGEKAERMFTKEQEKKTVEVFTRIIGSLGEQKDFKVKVGRKAEKRIELSLPNTHVGFKRSELIKMSELKRDTDTAPLAGIFWALSIAGKHLITAQEAPLFAYLIGVQRGLTAHMGVGLSVIEQNLPEGEKLEDYVKVDSRKMREAIVKNAHHLRIAAVVASTTMRPHEGFVRALQWVGEARDINLDTEFAARDTALMLEVATLGLSQLLEDLGKAGSEERRIASVIANAPMCTFRMDHLKAKTFELGVQLMKLQDRPEGPASKKEVAAFLEGNADFQRVTKDIMVRCVVMSRAVQSPTIGAVMGALSVIERDISSRAFYQGFESGR